ncbi:hypothetical protein U1Q18_026191 [Sarracenia purpurea var. burkii]
MDSQEKSSCNGGFFRMPLHYPRYTKEDYQDMPEGKLDRLLADYGLSVGGAGLAYKREFAMGAFLWPHDHHLVEPPPRPPPPPRPTQNGGSVSSHFQSFASSCLKKKV